MDQHFPDVLLIEGGAGFLVGHYFLVEVAVVWEFHHDAMNIEDKVPQRVGLDEGVLVTNNVGALDRS